MKTQKERDPIAFGVQATATHCGGDEYLVHFNPPRDVRSASPAGLFTREVLHWSPEIEPCIIVWTRGTPDASASHMCRRAFVKFVPVAPAPPVADGYLGRECSALGCERRCERADDPHCEWCIIDQMGGYG